MVLIPATAKPTIAKPITAPAKKATLKPLFRCSATATALRTLACTATVMPIYPARAEQTAPTIKAPAVSKPDARVNSMGPIPTWFRSKLKTTAMITPKITATRVKAVYNRFK